MKKFWPALVMIRFSGTIVYYSPIVIGELITPNKRQ